MPENPDQPIPESDRLNSRDDDGNRQETSQPQLSPPAADVTGYPHNHIISSHPQDRPAPVFRKSSTVFTLRTLGVVFAFAVAAATIVQAWTTCSQGKVLEQQGDTAEKQLLASRRPWVGVDVSLTADMVSSEAGYSVKMKFTTHNYGTTPAVGVYIHPTNGLYTPGFDLDGLQKKVCELGMDPAVFSMGGHDLFPTQTHDTAGAFDLPKSELAKSFEAYQLPGMKNVPVTVFAPFIIGCVTYRSTFDNIIHRTPYSFMLEGIDPKIIGNPRMLDTRAGTIPRMSIFVRPHISIGGIRAD